MRTYAVLGFSVGTYDVTGFSVGTDAVTGLSVVKVSVMGFSVGIYAVTRFSVVTDAVTYAVTDASFFSKALTRFSMVFYLSTEEKFHIL